MKIATLIILTLSACTGWAQSIDSTKNKPVNVPTQNTANAPAQNQGPSRSIMFKPTGSSANQPAPTFNMGSTQNRVQSTPIYESGRVIGGSTSFKFKKKD